MTRRRTIRKTFACVTATMLTAAITASAALGAPQGSGRFLEIEARARAAYHEGRLDDALAGYARCLSMDQSAAAPGDFRAAFLRQAAVLEAAGRRGDALDSLGRAAGLWVVDPFHRALSDDAFAGLREDARFEDVRATLETRRADALRWIQQYAAARRAELEATRAVLDGSPLRWIDGHVGAVGWIDVSPDGERLVSLGVDTQLLLWSMWLDEPPIHVGVHHPVGATVEFVDGGERILVHDRESRLVALYDGRSGAPLLEVNGARELVGSAVLAPDGTLWTVDLAGVLRGRNSSSGEVIAEVAPDVPAVTVECSPDGEALVVLGWDGRAWLADPRTGARTRTIDSGRLPLTSAAFDPLGRLALVADDGGLTLAPRSGNGVSVQIPGSPEGDLRYFSADGAQLLRAWSSRGIEMYDARNGAKIASLLDPGHQVRSVVMERGLVVASSGGVGTDITIWNAETAEQLSKFRTPSTVNSFAVTPDGRVALATFSEIQVVSESSVSVLSANALRVGGIDIDREGHVTASVGSPPVPGDHGTPWTPGYTPSLDNAVRQWSTGDGRHVRSIEAGIGDLSRPAFGPDGLELVVPGADSYFFRADGGHVRLDRPSRLADVSANGERIALTLQSPPNTAVHLFDREGPHITTIEGYGFDGHQPTARPARFDPTGDLLVVPLREGWLELVSAYDGETCEKFRAHAGVVTNLAFDPTSPLMASASTDGTVRVWSLDDLEPMGVIGPSPGAMRCCGFSPDGRFVVAAGDDAFLRVASIEQGIVVHALGGHAAPIVDLAFHGRTGLLVTASRDGTARVWDVEKGEELAVLVGHLGGVRSARFLPGDESSTYLPAGRIVTCGLDATVRVWDAATGRLLATHVEYVGGGWVTHEPGGCYVAGGDGAEYARIRPTPAGDLLPLSSYESIIDDPDAVAASLRGEEVVRRNLPAAPRVTATTRPTGTVDERRVKISAVLEDAAGIAEVVVERDGVPLYTGLDAPGLGDLQRGARRAHIDLAVEFASGADTIEVRVRARNVRDVWSAPFVLERRYEPPAGDLYIVTVAVDDYDDDRLDLAAPVNDATAILARFEDESGALYGEVHPIVLGGPSGKPVSRAAIDEAYERLYADAKEEDSIIVFVAGHGTRTPSGRYFFLTHDATLERPSAGIRGDDLYALVLSSDLAPRRRVLLLDTCHAGEDLVPGSRGIGDADAFTQERIDESVGSGIYILAASTEQGAARETARHGVFTAALLSGLDGAADDTGNGDGTIDVDELMVHARRVVAEAEGPQRVTTPRVQGGDPFPIARKR